MTRASCGIILAAVGSSMVVLCSYASAQQPPTATPPSASPSVPEDATNKLARDLATLQSQIEAAQRLAASQEAQQAGRNQVEVTRNGNVLSGADPSAPSEFVASKGTDLWVLDKQNGYYAVAAADGKTGWITSADVKPKKIDVSTGRKEPESWWSSQKMTVYDAGGQLIAAPQPALSIREKIFQTITESVVNLRDSYKNNPYFQVSGFTVGLPIPSASVTFTFK